jgi:F0F1-type ATP synthase membrane subunit b/b'
MFSFYTFLAELCACFVSIFLIVKFILPQVNNILLERKKRVQESIVFAEQSHLIIDCAQKRANSIIKTAKLKKQSIEKQNKQKIAEQIKKDLYESKLLFAAEETKHRKRLALEAQEAQKEIENHILLNTIECTKKFLQSNLDKESHKKLIKEIVKEL